MPAGLAEGTNIECGYLSVPANRKNPGAGTLQLATAIIHPPDGPVQADPIIYLEGGPGGSALEFLYLTYERNDAPLLQAGRDLILFDQRGVGMSRPALDCPEQDRLFLELLDNQINGRNLSEAEADQLQVQAMQTCAKNWAARADLSAFTTAENAADVADMAKALGYEQVNLWSISYGTRLAQEVMRRSPEIVRSVILDSAVPPDVDLYASQPDNVVRAFTLLFDTCAADKLCNAAYPNLKQIFQETVSQLDQQNASFNVTDPLAGQTYAVALSGDNFIELLIQFLYERELIPMLPRLIYNANHGDFDLFSRLAGSVIATQPALSDMMHFTVQCAEEIGQTRPEAVLKAAEKYPEYKDYFDEGFINLSFNICNAIGVQGATDSTVSEPVESDIPTLILAGEFDPVTPPEFGERIAAGLSSSYLYEFPAIGHGVSTQPGCPRQMVLAFLNDPSQKPDAACMDEMPAVKFDIPVTEKIDMETFSVDAMSIQGVRPAGWKEVKSGVFSRLSSSLDNTLVLVQTGSATPENTLQQLSTQFGLLQPPASVGDRKANRLEWKLYSVSVRSMTIDFAIAAFKQGAAVVLLQSAPDEREGLYNFVFLPVVDSLKSK